MSLVLETLFLIFARTPSLGSEPSFCDRAFSLLVSPTFLEPPRIAGADQGLARLCVCHPVRGFHNRRVELTSLASMARVTRLVSSLMGMFEWNLGPSFS